MWPEDGSGARSSTQPYTAHFAEEGQVLPEDLSPLLTENVTARYKRVCGVEVFNDFLFALLQPVFSWMLATQESLKN